MKGAFPEPVPSSSPGDGSTTAPQQLEVAAFYRFARLDPLALAPLREALLALGLQGAVKGTVLLAPEGVNGTVSGPPDGVAALLERLHAHAGLGPLVVKRHRTAHQAFHRLKVRLKPEIVTLGLPQVDPLTQVGTYVEPADWNALIEDPTTLLIDTRNAFEVAVGSFAGALDPGTRSFREFPAWVEEQLLPLVARRRPRRVALFCTGGIRCEKATSYLLQRGLEGVHHLRGGILAYLAAVEPGSSRWRGECFVFDQRVALNHRLEPGEHSLCHGCRMPLSPADRALPSYQEGVSCRHCASRCDGPLRKRLLERQRQMQLARLRGEDHLGRVFGPVDRAAAL